MAESSTRRVTSADVARIAGVSRATVSYVMNDTPHQTISADTRTRVLDAAARLGYAPSAAARTLRTGRSDVVLCLLPDWPIGAEVGSMLGNLSTALARQGFTLVVHPGNREDRPMFEIWKAITPAAVIAFTDFSPGEIEAMRAAGVALVVGLFGNGQPDGRRRELEVPQQLIGRCQAAHLLGAGHTRIGYAYPDDERVRIFAEPRLAGVRDECRESGVAGPATETVALEAEQAAAAVRRWHAAGVTAVCAYNDEVALAVLAGVRKLGGGAGLAVIGVDDIPPARLAEPALTTVTTDQVAFAAYLSATVVAAVHGRPGPDVPTSELVSLVKRDSA
ncbi:LacI family DNA-binding transcriptional regulator [Paractinoplanes ferrugineus]|uniref:LacI family transcriptional regulator n=1 Tax=Paractinoplanes ferrugineus TaxID=113564 RepID=A0A919J2S3_9ACTN|nr:LacI family DNA-binding transcriptional regulator [Actinoplanes ferrugineus]GIE11424.1 LacI family transcriptional regulator [Actinoplanes ferrugineus]